MKKNYKNLNRNGIKLINNYKNIPKIPKKIWKSLCNKLPISDKKLKITKEDKLKTQKRYRLINKYNFKI